MFLTLLLAQAVAASPPERIDLTVTPPCVPWGNGEEVVVCAKRGGKKPDRVSDAPQAKDGLPKAELGISPGVKLSGETEAADVGGFPSNRAMVRLKVKF